MSNSKQLGLYNHSALVVNIIEKERENERLREERQSKQVLEKASDRAW